MSTWLHRLRWCAPLVMLATLAGCGGHPASSPVAAGGVSRQTTYHPADTNSDGALSINELTAYIQGWKTGQFDDINLVTNAIAIWKAGEAYHYDASVSPPYAPGAANGSLKVDILPAEAVTAGARWLLDSASTEYAGGQTATGLTAGGHTVRFKAVSGWVAPSDQVVTVTNGQTATASATYQVASPLGADYGWLRVDLSPAGAISAGAKWSLDSDSTQYPSGGSIVVTAGSHTVHFGGVTYWTAPADKAVTVTAGQQTVASGTYTAVPITVSLSPSTWTLSTGQTKQFTATVTGTADTTVTWSATGGTISAGLYTAPATAGTYTVYATTRATPQQTGSATVTVTAGTGSLTTEVNRRPR